ncbi:tetratricopeptide repeat protein [Blastopirellula marina]|uniref:Uncharacterized protein n=1 Tax=Blastopirellula marina DSM 3645 TaxID=314230 RepID=A3ZM84_9BACT|nr:tetratricopeptide repeat protein [Blastopirellula marina]EAQ82053.1 hypothetical protein DSM3645_00025 [Blastopirellula marina DSM 3645]
MSEAQLTRAGLLMQQKRYDLAIAAYQAVLATDPDNAIAHAGIGGCLTALEKFADAEAHIRQALHLAPDEAFVHHYHAVYLNNRVHLIEAETAIRNAIALAPENADYYALLAKILGQRQQWSAAIQAAEHGLSIDPVNEHCLQWRAMLLLRSENGIDPRSAVDAVMQNCPDESGAHMAQGLARINQQQLAKAAEAFRESLRLDPTQEAARIGLIHCLRLNSTIFVRFLAMPAMIEVSLKTYCWLFTGVAFGVCWYLLHLAENESSLDIRASLFSFLLFAGIIFTFAGLPLSDLELGMDREGKHLLSRGRLWTSYAIAGLLVAALAMLVSQAQSLPARLLALAIGGQIPALSQVFRCKPGWPRRAMATLSTATAVCGLILAAGTTAANFVSPGLYDARLASLRPLAYILGGLIVSVPAAAHYLTKARVRK